MFQWDSLTFGAGDIAPKMNKVKLQPCSVEDLFGSLTRRVLAALWIHHVFNFGLSQFHHLHGSPYALGWVHHGTRTSPEWVLFSNTWSFVSIGSSNNDGVVSYGWKVTPILWMMCRKLYTGVIGIRWPSQRPHVICIFLGWRWNTSLQVLCVFWIR